MQEETQCSRNGHSSAWTWGVSAHVLHHQIELTHDVRGRHGVVGVRPMCSAESIGAGRAGRTKFRFLSLVDQIIFKKVGLAIFHTQCHAAIVRARLQRNLAGLAACYCAHGLAPAQACSLLAPCTPLCVVAHRLLSLCTEALRMHTRLPWENGPSAQCLHSCSACNKIYDYNIS